MTAAKAIAAKYGYTLTSAVLPRNQCDPAYIRVLRDLGFTAYRGMEDNWVENKVHVHFPLRVLRLTDTYFPITGYGSYTPKQEDGWLEVMNDRQTKNGIANIYNFIYKGEKALTLEEVQGYGANRYFISSKEYTLADYMRAVQNNSENN